MGDVLGAEDTPEKKSPVKTVAKRANEAAENPGDSLLQDGKVRCYSWA